MPDLTTRTEAAVRWITLDRPESRNSLTPEVNEALRQAIGEATDDREVRCLVLTGAGGAFCSGLDLQVGAQVFSLPTAELEARTDQEFHSLVRAIRRCPKPVVALVDGPAAGFGCDLALNCDIRLGTPRTRLVEVFVRRGLMPDGGGTFLLPRLVGLGRALEMVLTGDPVGADNGLQWGLLSRIFSVEQAVAETQSLAARLASYPPLAIEWIKRSIRQGMEGSFEDALARERQGQARLLGSHDFRESVLAWMEKRPPCFTGE